MKHKRTQAVIIKILNEEKELTTGEIYDRLVAYKSTSSKLRTKNIHLNVPMNALGNIMKRKTFQQVGFTNRKPTGHKNGRQAVWSNKEE